jgi:threonyl-tRNA synthetase
MAPKRTVAGDGPRMGATGKFEGDFKVCQNPEYLKHREEVWKRVSASHQAKLKTQAAENRPIKIELPDGKVKDGKAFQTTPLDIAQSISKGLADTVIVAKLIYREPIASLKQCVAADNDDSDQEEVATSEASVLWDVTRPLEGSCRMELLKFDDDVAKDVFWHSSAHILGQAMERQFGCHLTIGPALSPGFYYDGYFGSKKLADQDYKTIEQLAGSICKEAQSFERCELSKEDALELFEKNPFKVQLISNKVPDGAMTSCYKCGPLIDLCRGPHIRSTALAKAFKVTKNSAAYWLGDQKLDSLQRLYGVAFPSDKDMKAYEKFLEEAAKRDHRNVGKQQELFFQHPIASPGCTFWFPMGARIYNKLTELMRTEYRLRGFNEVITPNMYSSKLFMTSGHYQNYKDDMYSVIIEDEEWNLKPMNCPGHFLMFDHRARSYKELPMRYADFGVLHRNEASGALQGLTRVRRFQQDDAHIFIRADQIKNEVKSCLDFLQYIYGLFGFSASYALSTRPKKAIGSKELWENAESQLKAVLTETGMKWTLNPGDGAFYGPKIDIRLEDTMKRKFQCGTIQLDFNAPIRFNLQYRSETALEEGEANPEAEAEFKGAEERNDKGDVIWKEGKLKTGFERPVVIHRAILGSIERMSAILIEHYAGKWPFWLSPRQIMVIPVAGAFTDYAEWLVKQFMLHGFHAEVDTSGKTMQKKIRDAQLAQWNYIAVVGEKEESEFLVNVRQRDEAQPLGSFSLQDFIARLQSQAMPTSQPLNKLESYKGKAVSTQSGVAAPSGAAPTDTSKTKPASGDNQEALFRDQPYVKGFHPTSADLKLFNTMSERDLPSTPNLRRWFDHIESFTQTERFSWPDA